MGRYRRTAPIKVALVDRVDNYAERIEVKVKPVEWIRPSYRIVNLKRRWCSLPYLPE